MILDSDLRIPVEASNPPCKRIPTITRCAAHGRGPSPSGTALPCIERFNQ